MVQDPSWKSLPKLTDYVDYEDLIPKEDLLAVVKLYEAALRRYAKRNNWRYEVVDSYSGALSVFDWEGDEDDPWQIAENAIREAQRKLE